MASIPIRVGYDPNTQSVYACAVINTGLGPKAICASLQLAPIAQDVYVKLMREALARRGIDADEIGAFGFIKKAFDKVLSKAMKVAKAVGITKVVETVKREAKKALKAAKKIYESPIFAAALGIASTAVGVGPVVMAGYAATRAAMAVASRAAKGDPAALAAIGKYASGLVPGGEKVTALIQSVEPTVEAVAAQANPWLQGLQGGVQSGMQALQGAMTQ